MEAFNLELGTGSDTLTIESTHKGTTSVSGSQGSDTITLKTISGHTTVDAGAGADTLHGG